ACSRSIPQPARPVVGPYRFRVRTPGHSYDPRTQGVLGTKYLISAVEVGPDLRAGRFSAYGRLQPLDPPTGPPGGRALPVSCPYAVSLVRSSYPGRLGDLLPRLSS